MPTAPTELACSVCSSALLPDDPPTTTGLVCAACAGLPVCDTCDLPAAEPRDTVDHQVLCADCVTGWNRCEACDLYTTATTRTVDNGVVCGGCIRHAYDLCTDCLAYGQHFEEIDSGSLVCDDCLRYYHRCDNCDAWTSGGDYCDRCHDDRDSDRVHDYSYKPAPVFHGDGPLFLGLELELKTPRADYCELAELAADSVGRLGYLKEDSSIGFARGFELVTHPMSYRYAIEQFPWTLLTQLNRRGAFVDDEVGIHVHVSRAGFASPAHVYRWMKFFYRNESHATRLARRTSEQWASFQPGARAGIVDFAKGNHRYGLADLGRYQAINTLPRHTFEVRIFASSLVPQQVQATLGFAAASVDYTRTLTSGDVARRRGWEWTAFVTWLRSRPIYAPLLAELEELACAS